MHRELPLLGQSLLISVMIVNCARLKLRPIVSRKKMTTTWCKTQSSFRASWRTCPASTLTTRPSVMPWAPWPPRQEPSQMAKKMKRRRNEEMRIQTIGGKKRTTADQFRITYIWKYEKIAHAMSNWQPSMWQLSIIPFVFSIRHWKWLYIVHN